MDIEKQAGTQDYLPGYPSLAAFIASDPDQTSAVYKRFNRLASRHLLHLQSHLSDLQAEQDKLDREQHREDLGTKQYSRNWAVFCDAASQDARQKRRKELAEEIGRTLKVYSGYVAQDVLCIRLRYDLGEALFYESHLATLSRPTKRTLEAFRYRFFNCSSGPPYPTLGGNSTALYDDLHDLVALRGEDRDRLTAFLQDHCSWLFGPRNVRQDIIYAPDHRVARFVTILSTINAAALLVGAIVSLYATESPKTKLGIIALFTALFATNVGILTNARQAELFAATAGYAAVLVVFVSGNLGAESAG